MKKLFILTISLLFGAQLFGYTHTISNTTDTPMEVKVNLKAWPDKNYTLSPGETKKVDVVGWCTNAIEATGLAGGSASGLNAVGNVGACRSVQAFIEYTGPQQPTTQAGGEQVIINVGGTTAQPRSLNVRIR